jgi:branched-chain amino acid transport system substrate-binding protein
MAAVVILTVLAGCGSGNSEPPGNRIDGTHLTVYTSLPLNGYSAPAARAVLAGERQALKAAHGRVGDLVIRLAVLNDATVARMGWDPGQTTAAAQLAAADPKTIGYLGDLESGATAISIPLLNRVGIPQISPMSTAVGLARQGPGAAPGEPGKYYPTGSRTFVGLAPDDASQAAALVRVAHGYGCTRVDVLNDESVDGYDAAASFGIIAHVSGLDVVGSQSFDPRVRDFTSLATSLAGVAPDCVLLSAMPGLASVTIAREVAAALPHARLFATARLAVPSFVDPVAGGLPERLARRVIFTVPGWPDAVATAGRAWAALEAPFGLYGYEAMRLLLVAVRKATDGGHGTVRRSSVRTALMRAFDGDGPLGALTVRTDGSTTLNRWEVLRISAGRLARIGAVAGS